MLEKQNESYLHFTPEAEVELELDPDTKEQIGYVILKNISNVGVGFKFRCSNRNDVTVDPATGVLGPAEQVKVVVNYLNWHPHHSAHEKLQVLVAPIDDLYHADNNLHELFQRTESDNVQEHKMVIRRGVKQEPQTTTGPTPTATTTLNGTKKATTLNGTKKATTRDASYKATPTTQHDVTTKTARTTQTQTPQSYPTVTHVPVATQGYPTTTQVPVATQGYPAATQVPVATQGYPTSTQVPVATQGYRGQQVTQVPVTTQGYRGQQVTQVPVTTQGYRVQQGTSTRLETQPRHRGPGNQGTWTRPETYLRQTHGTYASPPGTQPRHTMDASVRQSTPRKAHGGDGPRDPFPGTGRIHHPWYDDPYYTGPPARTDADRYKDYPGWGEVYSRRVQPGPIRQMSQWEQMEYRIKMWFENLKQHRLIYPVYTFVADRPAQILLWLIFIFALLTYFVFYPVWRRRQHRKFVEGVGAFGGSAVSATAAAVAEFGESLTENRRQMTLDEYIHWKMT